MSTRAERVAETRARILDAVRALHREGAFHSASMEAIADRAGVTRVTLYRTFGSKPALLEAITWELLAGARLDRVDEAHEHPDVRVAVRGVLRANCLMFAELADALPLALELARSDPDMRALVDATYHGRRHRAMERLAGRIVRTGAAATGWTRADIADALLVLSSFESFQTLVEHRGCAVDKAGDRLATMAGAFLADGPPIGSLE